MSGVWGNNLKISIFGESHGAGIGITIHGLPSGINLNLDKISEEMKRRAPGNNKLSTQRKESDIPEIISGYFEGKITGTPLTAIIRNSDTRSKDYGKLKDLMRPGHADFTGNVRYSGFNDYRGGGHFSGRITAPLVFAGAICKQVLEEKGIYIGAHIKSIKDVEDEKFNDINIENKELEAIKSREIPVINENVIDKMKNKILEARQEGNSVGGIVECAVIGIEAGLGDPFFDSVESTLAHLLFSVPAVKGVEFGLGFDSTKLSGLENNDEFYYDGEKVKTKTNNNGGILGGITNGMPIIFSTAIKPTPSVASKQNTINIKDKTNESLIVEGRHDPCIVQRVVPVIEAVTAIGILDLIKGRYGWQI